MAIEVKVKTGEVELRATKLTKSLLKQMPLVEAFHGEYLPGGKEAQDPAYKIIGWVHGSVLETDENYWKWLVVQLEPGRFVRIRVEEDRLARLGLLKTGQIYIV